MLEIILRTNQNKLTYIIKNDKLTEDNPNIIFEIERKIYDEILNLESKNKIKLTDVIKIKGWNWIGTVKTIKTNLYNLCKYIV